MMWLTGPTRIRTARCGGGGSCGGEVVLAFGVGGLLAGCNFSHGAGTADSSTTAPATDGTKGSTNPLSGSSGNSSS